MLLFLIDYFEIYKYLIAWDPVNLAHTLHSNTKSVVPKEHGVVVNALPPTDDAFVASKKIGIHVGLEWPQTLIFGTK